MPLFHDRLDGSIIEAEQFRPQTHPLPFERRLLCCFNGEQWYIRPHEEAIPLSEGDWIVKRPSACSTRLSKSRYEWYPPQVFAVLYRPEP